MRETSDVAIDVVVPTRNRPEDLRRFLDSVGRQEHSNFRVLVFDQSDDTGPGATMVREAADDRLVHCPDAKRGKSRALNEAIRRSTSRYIALTDDDCEPAPDWLARAIDVLDEHDDVGIVFGNVNAYPHDEDTEFVPAIDYDSDRTISGPIWRSYGLVGMGANMILRRAAIDDAGGFDEDLGPGGVLLTGEDCEITYRVLQHGWSVLQDAGLDVLHYGGRATVDGTAAELINTGFYAVGAGYGKHLRRPSLRTFTVVLHELCWVLGLASRAIVTRRPPFHVRRFGRLVGGMRDGWRAGPNWPTEFR